MAFLRGMLLVFRGTLSIECDNGRAEREDEEHREDGDCSAAAATVAANAGVEEVPGAGAEFDAVGL